MSDSGESSGELCESELGKKEHWDSTYQLELSNFKSHGDTGDIWYGESVLNVLVSWIRDSDVPRDESVLDLGCGNGMLAVRLAQLGFSDIVGVDYSESAVDLAQAIGKERGLSITFECADIMQAGKSVGNRCLNRQYGLCVDKGTYDTVSLNPGSRPPYLRSVARLVRPEGRLLLVSCNWGRKALLDHFGDDFRLEHDIPRPLFQFGGRKGSDVTILVLRRLGNV